MIVTDSQALSFVRIVDQIKNVEQLNTKLPGIMMMNTVYSVCTHDQILFKLVKLN